MKRFTIWALLALMWLVVFMPEGIAQSDYRIRDAIVVRKMDGRGGIPLFWDGFIRGRYAGTTRDCFFYDYTGSGNYVIRLQGDSANIFTVDKSGNVWAAGSIGPATGAKLPDIGGTNWLTLKWNETSAADRTLNFLVSGGNRSLTIEADSLLNQDLTTDATPTFAGMIGSGLTASRLLSTNGSKALTSTDLDTWVAGTADDITVTDDGDGTITLSSVPYANTVTVGATGCDYTTIQAALTASGADTLILVYPGTYTDDTINFTANNQTVCGVDLTAKAHVTTADSQICDYGAYATCRIDRIKMSVTACTTAKTVLTGSGTIKLKETHIAMTCATDIVGADQPSCIAGTGDVKMVRGTLDYNHTGETVAGIKAPIALGTGAVVECQRAHIDIDTTGDALASTPAYGTSTGVFNPYRCDIDVTNATDGVSGLEDTFTIGHAYATGSGSHELLGNDIHVTNESSIGVGVYVAGTISVRVMDGHIHVESGGTANSYYFGAAGAMIESQMVDIIAAGGVNNAAGGTFEAAHSPADGELETTSTVAIGTGSNIYTFDPSTTPVYTGATRPTRTDQVNLNDFHPDPDGGSNSCIITDGYDSTNHRGYWRCTSSSASQDYRYSIDIQLPQNFSAFTGSNSISVDVRSSDYANCTATLTMLDNANAADSTINGTDVSPDANNTWKTTSAEPGSSYSAGQWIKLRIQVGNVDASDTTDVGRVLVSYLSSN